MGQSFGPDRGADRVPQHWASSGRDLGESVKNFIHVLTDASMRLSLQRKMLRRGHALLLPWYITFHNWLSHHNGWKQVLEKLNF